MTRTPHLIVAALLIPHICVAQSVDYSPRLVDVGGQRLEVVQRGQGHPVVVVEAGSGLDWRNWIPIMDSIAPLTTVVSYSRAGYGNSPPASAPRTPLQVTSELHALLRAIDAAPPYVLVGHSLGGLYMQVFAAQYPDEVAGLLLVDSSHERGWLEFDALSPGYLADVKQEIDSLEVARPEEGRTQEWIDLWPNMLRGALPEAHPLPNVPTVVLTSLQTDPESTLVVQTEAGRQLWRSLHSEFFAGTIQGAHVVTQSGHNIHMEEPGLVVESIRSLVKGVRVLDGEILSDEERAVYEGVYQLSPSCDYSIFSSGDQLFAGCTGQNPVRLKRRGDHVFILSSDANIRLEFVVQGDRAAGFTLYRAGRRGSVRRKP